MLVCKVNSVWHVEKLIDISIDNTITHYQHPVSNHAPSAIPANCSLPTLTDDRLLTIFHKP